MDRQSIEQVVGELHYPITKDEIIEEVTKRGAPEIVNLLKEHLPAQTFNSAEELMQKLPLGQLGNLGGML